MRGRASNSRRLNRRPRPNGAHRAGQRREGQNRRGEPAQIKPRAGQLRRKAVPPNRSQSYRVCAEPDRPSRLYDAMNPTKTLLGTLLVAALSAGCASSSNPNTARGAVGGAAAGAVLGGIIGNNTGGDTKKSAAIGAAAGGLAGAAIGNTADRRAENAAATADRGVYAQPGYVIQQPPPAPTSAPYESMGPRPSRDAVWVAGYYDYVGGDQYRWVPGHWENPPAGQHTWVPAGWQQTTGGYVWNRGRWQ